MTSRDRAIAQAYQTWRRPEVADRIGELVPDLVTGDDEALPKVTGVEDVAKLWRAIQREDATIGEITKYRDWVATRCDEQIAKHEERKANLKAIIRGWVEVEGSVNLPDLGTAFTQTRKGVKVTDEAAVKAWAEANECIRVVPEKREIDKTKINEAVLKDGQAVPGTEVETNVSLVLKAKGAK